MNTRRAIWPEDNNETAAMARRVSTVAELAASAGMDAEDVLINLWDAGLDRYKDPRDRIPRRDMDLALRAVGVPTRSDLTDPSYWIRRLGLSGVSELRALLDALGTPMRAGSRSLPKGAIAQLKRHLAIEHGATVVIDAPAVPETVQERLVWRTVGRRRPLRLLTAEEVIAAHEELVADFAMQEDPIDPPGVRSEDLLESAVYRQHTGLGGEAKYPTAEMAAAALLHAIVHDHPFHNGNKRTALVAMLMLLDENGLTLFCSEDDLFSFVLRLAQHKRVTLGPDLPDREMLDAADWICGHSRNTEKGERPVQWRKLRQILTGYGCDLSKAVSVGNRMNIERTVETRGRFGRRRQLILSAQVKYADDGRDAQVDTIKTIRRQLQLDEEHGIDSFGFYQRGGVMASEFIMRYRKTLKRLARL